MTQHSIENDRPPDRQALLAPFLADHDCPCPVCAYNLRSMQTPICPECGADLELRVGAANLRLGPWITALLCASATFGASAVFATIGFIFVIIEPGAPNNPFVFGWFLVMTVVHGPGLVMLIARRRRIWRLSPRRQWRVAIWFSAATLAIFILAMTLLFQMT